MDINLAGPVSVPARWIALALAGIALAGFGYVKGLNEGATKFERFVGDVKVVGVKQQAKVDAADKQATEISKDVGENYEKSSKRLADLYGPGRVQHARSGAGSGKAPTVSEASSRPDAGPSDIGLGAGVRAPEEDACRPLKADAARTTLMLLSLQAWVTKQEAGWNSMVDPEGSAP